MLYWKTKWSGRYFNLFMFYSWSFNKLATLKFPLIDSSKVWCLGFWRHSLCAAAPVCFSQSIRPDWSQLLQNCQVHFSNLWNVAIRSPRLNHGRSIWRNLCQNLRIWDLFAAWVSHSSSEHIECCRRIGTAQWEESRSLSHALRHIQIDSDLSEMLQKETPWGQW